LTAGPDGEGWGLGPPRGAEAFLPPVQSALH
jgi:hypothetical protein